MSRSVQRALIASALLALVAAIAVAGSGPTAGALMSLPLGLLILPLLFDRGEALIDRLARPKRTVTRRRRPISASRPRGRWLHPVVPPRGGRLIACSLAVRPPPAPSLLV